MNVVLGVTGSISAYKAVDIMRAFLKNGHDVSVVMTEAALKFIPALPFDTFTPGKVYCDMWEVRQDPLIHINLGKDNDLLLIAPASANTIGKIANGIADDLLSATFLAFNKQVVIAPAMNTNMYEHPAVKENIARLITRGVSVIEPEVGELACRVEGKGKLPSPETIYEHCIKLGAVKRIRLLCLRRLSEGPYAGSARGPATREGVKLPLDPRSARQLVICEA